MSPQAPLLAALLSIALGAQAREPAVPSASQILERIERIGSGAALSEISKKHGEYGQILKNISSGQADWLLVGRGLAPALDGFAASELFASLAFALESAPRETLRALDAERQGILPVADVCSAGALAVFDEGGAKVRRWTANVRRKLRSVEEPELLQKKAMCVVNLPR